MSRILPHYPATKNLPATRPSHENITLLTVTPCEDDRQVLESILDDVGWTVRGAKTVRKAMRLFEAIAPSVILCDRVLPDGSWKDLLHIAQRIDSRPPVVVFSNHADERLWAEVFNLGGFDVLLKPFETNEVLRVLRMASRYSEQQEPAYLCAAV